MEKKDYFTPEELAFAKSVSLSVLAEYLGYHPVKKNGKVVLAEHDSLVLFNDATWCRFSAVQEGRSVGGSTIDFMLQFGNCQTTVEAVLAINEIFGNAVFRQDSELRKEQAVKQTEERKKQKKDFFLPPRSGHYRNMYAYLMKKRRISSDVIRYFSHDLGLLYQDERGNLVFLGKDKEGQVRYAALHGTYDMNGNHYRGEAAGSTKSCNLSIINEDSDEIRVFEAHIDLMSYIDLCHNYGSNYSVLGGVSDLALERILKENPHIKKIIWCLDNDTAGRQAAEKYSEKYEKAGYTCGLEPPVLGKDFNEMLQIIRKAEKIRQDREELEVRSYEKPHAFCR